MENNPLLDAALAELDRIYAAVSKEYANGEKCLTENVSKALEFANDIHRAYPALRQRLLDAESRLAEVGRERDECPYSQNTGTAISSNDSGDEYAMRCCCDAGAKRDKDRLVRELAEARKDSERLDWLEKKGLSTTQYAGRDFGVHSWLEPVTGQLMWTARYIGSLFCSLRSAIDAARGAK